MHHPDLEIRELSKGRYSSHESQDEANPMLNLITSTEHFDPTMMIVHDSNGGNTDNISKSRQGKLSALGRYNQTGTGFDQKIKSIPIQ